MSIPEGGLFNDKTRSIGKITQHHPATYIVTGVAECDIPFGSAVVRGDSENGVKLPTDATAKLVGVAAYSFDAAGLEEGMYKEGDAVSVVQIGIVSVKAAEAVKLGDDVRIFPETTTADFCTTADSGVTLKVTGAEWKSEIADEGLAELYLNGPFELTED